MKRYIGVMTVALVLVALGAGPAAAQFAQGDDPLLVLPDVFVVIDTSGSMGSCCYPCGVGGVLNCDRRMATRQVLTGTFTGAVGDCNNQWDDGILDVYKDHIRFGYSTFDSATNLNTYDYGDDTNCAAGQCLGIRNRTSTMVDLVDPADPEDQLGNNVRVQDRACQNIASGMTPLAGVLYDTLYYFNNWESEIGYNDEMSACRPKFVLLMTDGDANYNNWYISPLIWAAQNLANGIPVFVVAFGGGAAGANAIAQAGSGGLLNAFSAADPASLFIAFSAVLDAILSGTTSRTEVVSSGADVAFSTSHQYAAFFEITMSGLGWQGHLVQLPIVDRLANGEPVYGPVADWIYFEDELAAMNPFSRNIYTVVNDPRSQSFNWDVYDPGFDNSNLPRYHDDGDPMNKMVTFGAGMHDALITPWMCLGDPADLDPIRNWVRGVPGTLSAGGQYMTTGPFLGDIFHSTPVVAKPPTALSPDFAYEMYFRNNVNRDTMVYVGTNGGLLHAFVAEDNDNSGDLGQEAWAFLPNNLLAKIQKVRMTRDKYVDGSPVLRDVYFNNIATTHADGTPFKMGAYRTVLISGERGGGDTYFALDVTEPHNPGYLWEYRTGVSTVSDYATVQCNKRLMESWSKPIVGQVWLKNEHSTAPENTYVERSVMIVPGGYVPAASLMDFSNCVDFAESMVSASSLHVVDVETGKLLKKFQFGDGLEGSAEALLDQYYAELEDCEVNGNCTSFQHIGVGNRFTGTGWFCGTKRHDVRNPTYVPPELMDHCVVFEDDTVYRKECCHHNGTGPCNSSGLTSCYYLYEKKKNVPGGLRIIIKTEGCEWVPDDADRGRIDFEVEDDIWLESVAAKPVAYDQTLGEYLSRIFVPTTNGRVWRVDMARALFNHEGVENPSNDDERLIKEYQVDSTDYCWDVTREDDGHCNPAKAPVAWFDMQRDDTITNPATGRPVMTDPSLAMDYNRELILYFGTGFTDNLEYTTTQDYFYGVREAHKVNSFELEPLGQLVDVVEFSSTSERIFGKPLVAAGNVFFTTYVPIDDDCLPGYAKTYGLKFTDFDSPDNPIPVPLVMSGAGTPSAPALTMTNKGPIVMIQQSGSLQSIDLGASLKPTAVGMHWGKVL